MARERRTLTPSAPPLFRTWTVPALMDRPSARTFLTARVPGPFLVKTTPLAAVICDVMFSEPTEDTSKEVLPLIVRGAEMVWAPLVTPIAARPKERAAGPAMV